jgi:hypothetical protein
MRTLIAILTVVLVSTAAEAKKTAPSSCRDAKTGRYVTASYAKRYPGLTVCSTKRLF